jgi:hypothetical protein
MNEKIYTTKDTYRAASLICVTGVEPVNTFVDTVNGNKEAYWVFNNMNLPLEDYDNGLLRVEPKQFRYWHRKLLRTAIRLTRS